jgi:hypothetical protein
MARDQSIHVACIDRNNNVFMVDSRTYVSFDYNIPQQDEFYKEKSEI